MDDEIETVGDLFEAVGENGGELVIGGYVVRLIGRFPAESEPSDPDSTCRP